MINRTLINTFTIIASLLLFLSCGNGESPESNGTSAETEEQGLTEFELEHGMGPVTERIELDNTIDDELASKGQSIFEMKCEMCHNMEGRMVGPELGEVMDRRSPEFVMNMILNPGGMTREHPEGQKLLQEYMTAMPFQNVKENEARAIVEYLRNYSENN